MATGLSQAQETAKKVDKSKYTGGDMTKKLHICLTEKQTKEVIMSLRSSALYRSTAKQKDYIRKLLLKIEEQTNARLST